MRSEVSNAIITDLLRFHAFLWPDDAINMAKCFLSEHQKASNLTLSKLNIVFDLFKSLGTIVERQWFWWQTQAFAINAKQSSQCLMSVLCLRGQQAQGATS
jgi:hypothetical protein